MLFVSSLMFVRVAMSCVYVGVKKNCCVFLFLGLLVVVAWCLFGLVHCVMCFVVVVVC